MLTPKDTKQHIDISICMITYGHENFIKDAIESVLAQKVNANVELIIVNDNSLDQTETIVKSVMRNYNGPILLRYFFNNTNKGVMKNFSYALNLCEGKYIAVLEGDDFWRDNYKLEKQYSFLELNNDYALSGHNAITVNENGVILSKSKLKPEYQRDYSKIEVMKCTLILTLSLMFRNVEDKSLYDFYDYHNCDFLLISRLGVLGKYHYHSDIENGAYRLHSSSFWSSKGGIHKNYQLSRSFYYLFDYHKARGTANEVISHLFKMYLHFERSFYFQALEFKEYKLMGSAFYVTLKKHFQARRFKDSLAFIKGAFVILNKKNKLRNIKNSGE